MSNASDFLVPPPGISLVHQVLVVTELVRGRRESGMSERERCVSISLNLLSVL